MTATNNLPLIVLAETVLVNAQGSARRMSMVDLAALIGNGGSGDGSPLAAEVLERIAADDALRADLTVNAQGMEALRVDVAEIAPAVDPASVPAGLLASAGALVLDPVLSVTDAVGADLGRVPFSQGTLDLTAPYPEETGVAVSVAGRPAIGALMGRDTTRMRLVASGTTSYRGLLPSTGDWTLVLAHRTTREPVLQTVMLQGRTGAGTINLHVNCVSGSADMELAENTYFLRYVGVTDGSGAFGYPALAPAKSGQPHVIAVVKASGDKASSLAVDGQIVDRFTAPPTDLTLSDSHLFSYPNIQVGPSIADPGGQQIGRLVMIPRALTDDEVAWVSEWVGRSMGLGASNASSGGADFVPISAVDYAALTDTQRNDPTILYLVTA